MENVAAFIPVHQSEKGKNGDQAGEFSKEITKIAKAKRVTPAVNQQQQVQLLTQAIKQAKDLGDRKAESHGLGNLGKLYENNHQLVEAEKLTKQALAIAHGIQASEISYQWEWQLATILRAKGDLKGAIAFNEQAINTWQSIRSDLVAIDPDAQFSFQTQIEPIYRHLVSLLLELTPNQSHLKQARNAIESLKLAELNNYFCVACLHPKVEQLETAIEQSDPTAAIVYPIILPDRLATIFSLPGHQLTTYSTFLPETKIEEKVRQFRQAMSPAISNQRRLGLSQEIYNWLIKPIEGQLADRNIKTLVFVLDGVFRNIPMAALHDGDRYLIEKYSIALSPGLQLVEPRSFHEIKAMSLTGGLSEARSGFSPLPAVKEEVKQISNTIPSQVLLNQEFNRQNLANAIANSDSPVIHLATHGQFSSKPEKTFLLTWDERLDANTLSQMLQERQQRNAQPIELLVLSACQTASGDKKAALGLAGLAVRSGVRSTVATLWSVNDRSTTNLMGEFYQNLIERSQNKAEALRQAQLLLLKQERYQHPYYWAPFILLGNWL